MSSVSQSNDRLPDLLHRFGKAQALRLAMLDTLQNYPDPYDGSAFTLMGTP